MESSKNETGDSKGGKGMRRGSRKRGGGRAVKIRQEKEKVVRD